MSELWSIFQGEIYRVGLYNSEGLTLAGYTAIILLPIILKFYSWTNRFNPENNIEDELVQMNDQLTQLYERVESIEDKMVDKADELINKLNEIEIEIDLGRTP